ncbi:MAG TPA: hypothetical protein VHV08_05650, partial [Pirellulales bacterium]|nr:hypothetical protein [Pirellulales bacterium]
MKCLLSTLMLLMLAGAVVADEQAAQPVDISATVDRALAFLTKDALDWRTEHKCVSCHHAGLVVWALRAAKQRGHAVDDAVLADLAKWTSEAGGNGTTGVPRPEGIPKALNEKAISLALALGADPAPDAVARDGAQRMLKTILADQTENGSWSSWPETRQPIFGNSDERATAAAALAILQVAAVDDVAAKTVRDKAVQWLIETKTDSDPQSTALRLVLWRRLDKSGD